MCPSVLGAHGLGFGGQVTAVCTLGTFSVINLCFSFVGQVNLLWPCVPGNKLAQKDNAKSGVPFITLAGPRQRLLLAKDPNQFL